MPSPFQKSWISPFLGCLFLIIAGSGLLMFFHVHAGALKVLHEWIGLFFVAAGILHVTLNWKKFQSYLTERRAAVSIIAALAICLLLIVTGIFSDKGYESHRGYHGHRGIAEHR